jgi:hypothetical protein
VSGLRRIIAAVLTRDPARPVQVGHTSPPLVPAPVTETPAPQVVMVLDLAQAEILAKALIRFDATADPDTLDFPFDGALWTHVAIELLSSVSLAGPHPLPVYARFLDGADRAAWSWFANTGTDA